MVGSHTKVPEQGGAHSRGRAGFTSSQDTSSDVVGDYIWSVWVVWKAREVEVRIIAMIGIVLRYRWYGWIFQRVVKCRNLL